MKAVNDKHACQRLRLRCGILEGADSTATIPNCIATARSIEDKATDTDTDTDKATAIRMTGHGIFFLKK